jgi:hypothetical protein
VDKLVATTGLTYWFPKEREGYMYDLLSWQKKIMTFVFIKTLFFAENRRKSPKIEMITLTPEII